MLERSCFQYAQAHHAAALLHSKKRTCSEAAELTTWLRELQACATLSSSSSTTSTTSTPTSTAAKMARAFKGLEELRHTAVHRIPVSGRKLLDLLQRAAAAAVVLEDAPAAAAIRRLRCLIQARLQERVEAAEKVRERAQAAVDRLEERKREIDHMIEHARHRESVDTRKEEDRIMALLTRDIAGEAGVVAPTLPGLVLSEVEIKGEMEMKGEMGMEGEMEMESEMAMEMDQKEFDAAEAVEEAAAEEAVAKELAAAELEQLELRASQAQPVVKVDGATPAAAAAAADTTPAPAPAPSADNRRVDTAIAWRWDNNFTAPSPQPSPLPTPASQPVPPSSSSSTTTPESKGIIWKTVREARMHYLERSSKGSSSEAGSSSSSSSTTVGSGSGSGSGKEAGTDKAGLDWTARYRQMKAAHGCTDDDAGNKDWDRVLASAIADACGKKKPVEGKWTEGKDQLVNQGKGLGDTSTNGGGGGGGEGWNDWGEDNVAAQVDEDDDCGW